MNASPHIHVHVRHRSVERNGRRLANAKRARSIPDVVVVGIVQRRVLEEIELDGERVVEARVAEIAAVAA